MNLVKKTVLKLMSGMGSYATGSSILNYFIGLENGFSFRGLENDNKLVNEGYASNTDIYSIIRLIIQKASTVPFVLYIETEKGLEEVKNGDLFDLLIKPNPNQTQKKFRESVLMYSLLTGDRFYNTSKNTFLDDTVREIEVLPSNMTEVLVSNVNNEVIGYQLRKLNGFQKFDKDSVYHGKLFNPTAKGIYSHRGLSPLQAGYRSLDASNQSITARASFYKNKGKTGIVSSGTDDTLLSKEKKEIQDKFDKDIGGAENFNGIHTTTANIKYTAIGSSPSDMEMFKSVSVDLQALCRLYGIDSKLLGDPKASTHNNLIQSEKSFYTNAVIPNNQDLIDDLTDFLLPGWSEEDGVKYVLRQDTSGIEALQANQKEQAEKNKIVAETITSILSAAMSDESKIATLIASTGITEDEARLLLPSSLEGTGASENTGGNVQVQSLNGAQVTSMVGITAAVSRGELPKESAIGILMSSFGMPQDVAASIISPIEINSNQDE